MISVSHLRQVAVTDLCYGLYVAEPDRPWTEIPLMFQGFRIADDEELEVLRSYCHHVYIDPARSTAAALRALDDPGTAAEQDARLAEQRPELDTADAFSAHRQPDTSRFSKLLRRAWESHSQTRRFVEAVFRGPDQGEIPDESTGRAVVADMLQTVTRNPGAALWLSNLDDRDAETSVHSVNVCILALSFGAHLGLDREELEHIGLGALLHDIGKICTPRALLEKPEPLTAAEWGVLQRHPQDGYEILVEKGDFAPAVLAIVRQHHERLDGSGYPAGLSGVQIPLHVRVVALANAYDALTSDRVYRAALPADQALQRLYNGAEQSFGARLVQEFIRCVGIYPPGCLVELDNGAVGIVIGSRPDARIQPTVLLVRTPGGEFYQKRVVLNLAAEAAADAATPARHIRRSLSPADEEIDVAGIVAIEFGVDALA